MPTIKFKDADNSEVYFYVDSGAGTLGDPYILGSAVADYDTGAGTDNIKVVGIAVPADGGFAAGGTSSNPIVIDPSNTTSTAITAADGADVTQGDVDDAAITTDAAGTISGKVRGLISLFVSRIPALGQATKANSIPVTIASDTGLGVDQTVDDAYAGNETGPLGLYVRDDALTTITPADGDFAPARIDKEGAQWTRHKAYGTVTTGERQGSATAVQLPTVSASMVNIKAVSGNAGSVWIGDANDVTAADGTTDVTTGFELAAGEETGWLPIPNLNVLYMICDNAGDDITYMVVD